MNLYDYVIEYNKRRELYYMMLDNRRKRTRAKEQFKAKQHQIQLLLQNMIDQKYAKKVKAIAVDAADSKITHKDQSNESEDSDLEQILSQLQKTLMRMLQDTVYIFFRQLVGIIIVFGF